MQMIDLYCRKCKKSLRVGYVLTGDDAAPALDGAFIKCCTHKCTRVMRLKGYTEGLIKMMAGTQGKCYL